MIGAPVDQGGHTLGLRALRIRTASAALGGGTVVSVAGEVDHRHLDGSGGRLAVVVDDVNLLRLFRLTELDRLLHIFPSHAAALNGEGR